ncbi:MAG: NAD(+) synthase [Desulfosalsimonas sp.]
MKNFLEQLLRINPEQTVENIIKFMRYAVKHRIRRRGLVVALSGGIDSSVTAALAVRALGESRVFGLEMPERHSAPETLSLSGLVANHFNIQTAKEDISDILDAYGFYQRYDAAVQNVIPEYGDGWKSKIVSSEIMETRGFSFFSIVARPPNGKTIKKRLPLNAYLEIVAATNFKQRTRKTLEYYHADRLNYAVTGTPNRLEYELGFFVKLGDGAADIKPIAHLYKTQVYQLAKYLGVPEEIRSRPPTTDTYSLPQGQDEFYFSLPYDRMDICLYGKNNGYTPAQVADSVSLTPEQTRRVYEDIDTKRSTTRYLHMGPQLVEEIAGIKN